MNDVHKVPYNYNTMWKPINVLHSEVCSRTETNEGGTMNIQLHSSLINYKLQLQGPCNKMHAQVPNSPDMLRTIEYWINIWCVPCTSKHVHAFKWSSQYSWPISMIQSTVSWNDHRPVWGHLTVSTTLSFTLSIATCGTFHNNIIIF